MNTRSKKDSHPKGTVGHLRNGFPSLRFFGSEFVLNTETGMFYRVTPTVKLLLQAMENGAEQEALVDVIQNHCSVNRMTAIRDVELLINELSVRGILTS